MKSETKQRTRGLGAKYFALNPRVTVPLLKLKSQTDLSLSARQNLSQRTERAVNNVLLGLNGRRILPVE